MPDQENALPKILLLVDDDDFVAVALRQQLLQRGWDVDAARSIEAGLALVRVKNYSCVCIDLHLTGSTTGECLQLIESVRMMLPAASIVGASAYSSAELEMSTMAAGADRLLRKLRDVRAVAQELESICHAMRGSDGPGSTETAAS